MILIILNDRMGKIYMHGTEVNRNTKEDFKSNNREGILN